MINTESTGRTIPELHVYSQPVLVFIVTPDLTKSKLTVFAPRKYYLFVESLRRQS